MKSVQLSTSDHYVLSGTLFEPSVPNGKFLLINSATGVRQQMYYSFAQYLSKHGITVLTYDYRGIGLSKPEKLKGFKASMRTWGSVDYPAATRYIKENYSEYEKYCLGHSVGALILGMNEDSEIFDEFIFVATQKAYIGNLTMKTKIEGYLGFGIVQPVSTKLLGYFPAHRFGLGESLPAGSANDWRTLILNRKSTNRLLEKTTNISHKLHQKVMVLMMEDDHWVTNRGVKTLLRETYPNLQPFMRKVKVSESEYGKIGHVNFFRSYNRKLWKIVLDSLL